MTVDCKWLDKNLEAMLSEDLGPVERTQARLHLESCERCRREVQGIDAIDPLIQKYFRAQLGLAQTARSSRPSAFAWRRIALRFGSVAAAAAILFAIAVSSSQVETNPPAVAVQSSEPSVPPVEEPIVIKADPLPAERAKPSVPADRYSIPGSPVVEADANTPPFLITDQAGYSRSLSDFGGFTTLIAVWSGDQPESIANIDRLYRTFGSNPKLRVVGVSNQRTPKPADTTFPVFYNQGSRLLDLKSGEFVLLNEAGTVRMRGSMVKDFDGLSATLQN